MKKSVRKDMIRTEDIIGVLKDGPVVSISDLASRFADKEDLTSYDWVRLKANVGAKLRRLVKSGYVEKVGIGERCRWRLVE